MNCIGKWGRKKSGPFFDIMNLFLLRIVYIYEIDFRFKYEEVRIWNILKPGWKQSTPVWNGM